MSKLPIFIKKARLQKIKSFNNSYHRIVYIENKKLETEAMAIHLPFKVLR